MQSAFESWVGQHVVVRLTLGKTKVSLRGILLKEGPETLLMGPEFGSELEIPKKIILAIEEVGAARLPVPLAPSGSSAFSAHFRNASCCSFRECVTSPRTACVTASSAP